MLKHAFELFWSLLRYLGIPGFKGLAIIVLAAQASHAEVKVPGDWVASSFVESVSGEVTHVFEDGSFLIEPRNAGNLEPNHETGFRVRVRGLEIDRVPMEVLVLDRNVRCTYVVEPEVALGGAYFLDCRVTYSNSSGTFFTEGPNGMSFRISEMAHQLGLSK